MWGIYYKPDFNFNGVMTVTGENGSGKAVSCNSTYNTWNHNSGTVTFTYNDNTKFYFKSVQPLYNVIVNHADAEYRLTGSPDDLNIEIC